MVIELRLEGAEIGSALPPEVAEIYQGLVSRVLSEVVDSSSGLFSTGDIPACWPRDAEQTAEALLLLGINDNENEVKGVINRVIVALAQRIVIDPFANAYRLTRGGSRPAMSWFDSPPVSPEVFERKWEVDTPAYFLRMARLFNERFPDIEIYNNVEVRNAINRIIRTYELAQGEEGCYSFHRPLSAHIKRSINQYPGIIQGGFGPSDDYFGSHLVASNLFAAQELRMLPEVEGLNRNMVNEMVQKVIDGINAHGIINMPGIGRVYTFAINPINEEVLDDPNLPNLLTLPLVAPDMIDPDVYGNTIAYVYSDKNPNAAQFELSGRMYYLPKSIHTPGKVWPMSLLSLGLLSNDHKEILGILQLIGLMAKGSMNVPESIDPNDKFNRDKYTRQRSFMWANALYILLVHRYMNVKKTAEQTA